MENDHALRMLLGLYGSEPPPILYHYTSMQGLLSIVETGRIRATHIRYLNDWTEAETMWTLVFRRLEERRDSAKSTDEKVYLSEIISWANARRSANEFIASFSEAGDDLNQWRSYCPGEAGYSIGFSSAALRSQWVSDPSGGKPSFVGAHLSKVSYINEKNTSEIDFAIDSTLELASQLHGTKGFSGTISKEQIVPAWLSIIAPSYKSSVFINEREWRIILTKPHKPMPGQRFRPSKSSLIPYIEVELNRDTDFKLSDEYMIRKVFVGPTPNPSLSVEALQKLFLSKGPSKVMVENSTIPFRHW